MTDREIGDALRDRQALIALSGNAGWGVLCSRFDDEFKKLTDEVLDTKTDNERAEILRQARGKIAEDFSPRKMLSNLLIKLDAIASKVRPSQPPE